jgi:hypothetical protein
MLPPTMLAGVALLAEILHQIIKYSGRLSVLRAGIRLPRTLDEHFAHLIAIHAGALSAVPRQST